jgi:hypothetical protein
MVVIELLLAFFLLAVVMLVRIGGRSRSIAKANPEYGRPIFNRTTYMILVFSMIVGLLLLASLTSK